jgi:single-strand DNA-binding protein
MFHRVTVIGHLGGDPETRFTQSGTNVCSFNIATTRKWTNNDGTPAEETVWFRVSAWGKLGEICQQYLHKGKQVFIEGELVPDRETGGPRLWSDQNGQSRASYELRAATMKMLGGRDDAGGGSYSNDNASAPTSRSNQQAAPARQQAAPAQQQRAPQSAGGNRRSTMSAPQQAPADDFDNFGPDDIPF